MANVLFPWMKSTTCLIGDSAFAGAAFDSPAANPELGTSRHDSTAPMPTARLSIRISPPDYVWATTCGRLAGVRLVLGPVHTMSASANGWHGAPIEALDKAQTGRLREESNEEWRPRAPVPFGLLPKSPCASLQSLA